LLLPMNLFLSDSDIKYVAETIKNFYKDNV
jgi:hypothetical protein